MRDTRSYTWTWAAWAENQLALNASWHLWFKVTFLGWLTDLFKGLSDLQLGDKKGPKIESHNRNSGFIAGLTREANGFHKP